MGKLTPEVFNESCCDGGVCPTNTHESSQPCGCDMGCKPEPHYCERHQEELDTAFRQLMEFESGPDD